eukprot:TRINITY_DN5045_c0_g2_i1.p1 TRINITY_DN5045_c0_g2~~TRINITY_DN5045_c0_g2_i1.p1  ORF type:complete len:234 (+),score=54.74 TRINITY_DN5045_c0_g2_i1:79-702(+)
MGAAAAGDQPGLISLLIQDLAGNELELEVAAGTSVRELKLLIAENWSGMPFACQQLMLEMEVLEDASELPMGAGAAGEEGDCQSPSGEPLRILCLYCLPYEGSIEKAAAANDRAAVRTLLTERDKGRDARVPAFLQAHFNRAVQQDRRWPRRGEALVERGYTQEEVDEALRQLPEASYAVTLKYLEDNVRSIPSHDVPFLKWWRKNP